MADKSWKAFERRLSKMFPNGKRRGADYGDSKGGKSDRSCDGGSPELKLLGKPSFSAILSAIAQAKRNCEDDKVPIAIVKRKKMKDMDSVVCMDLETFRDWFLPPVSDEKGDPEPFDSEPPT